MTSKFLQEISLFIIIIIIIFIIIIVVVVVVVVFFLKFMQGLTVEGDAQR